MSPPREIELKLEVPARNLPRLTAGSLLKGVTTSATEPARLVSVYYDTKKGKLRQQGLSLRVRRTGRRLVQTVKQEHNGNAALFARGEWEQDIDAKQPNLDAARNTPLAPLLNKKLRRGRTDAMNVGEPPGGSSAYLLAQDTLCGEFDQRARLRHCLAVEGIFWWVRRFSPG